MSTDGHGFKLKGSLKRATLEYHYFTSKNWTLQEVGEFWDSVTDYDDINETTYSYYRRFTDSFLLAKEFVKSNSILMDIQARSGKGSEFWFQKGLIKKSYLIDFSDYLISLANDRLKNTQYDYEVIKVLDYRLPFSDCFFDLITSYETIEHIGNTELFMQELSRVLKPGGILILTCPNLLWEPMHWLSATFDIHHSEGPHRFLKRQKIIQLFKKYHLNILKEKTTVLIPFQSRLSITFNEFLEKILPEPMIRPIGLRRSFVGKKIETSEINISK